MKSYDELLERAYSMLPEKVISRDRFEIPRVSVQKEGSRTIVKNFGVIAKTINRSEEHLYKYLVRSLGTAGVVESGRLILQGKFTDREIQKEIDDYVRTYVLCKECGAPDTEFVREERVLFVKCLACGAKHSVKGL